MTNAVAEDTAYKALGLQVSCHAINGMTRHEARSRVLSRIDAIYLQIQASKARLGPRLRLVVLPEYVFTGHPLSEEFAEWADLASFDRDGVEYARLAEASLSLGIYLSVNAYERDEHFPGIYFQACVIFGPDGSTVLRYHRLNSLFSVTPYDVLDRYLEIYGEKSLFPVAHTEVGNLAAIASEEILFPEVARCCALRGAEVFVHNTSELSSALPTTKAVAKLARAAENNAYVVSANTSGLHGTTLPAYSGDGGSVIVDYRGITLAAAAQGESMAANAEIDLAALRRHRRTPGQDSLLSRQRPALYAAVYSQADVYPRNTVDGSVVSRQHLVQTQGQVIDRLVSEGLL